MSGYGSSSDSGYGNSGYGNSGYGDSGYNSNDPGYGDSGYNDSKFDGSGDGTASTSLGAGNNPYRTRGFADGYRGNQFEVNQFDSPYSETAANPFPQGDGYGSGSAAAFGTGSSKSRNRDQAEEVPMTPPPQPQGVVNAESSKSPERPRRGVRQQAPKQRQRTYSKDDQLIL